MAKKEINVVNDIEDELVNDMFVERIEEDVDDYENEDSEYEEIIEDDFKETYDEYSQRMELQRKANSLDMNIAIFGGIILFIALCVGIGFLIYK